MVRTFLRTSAAIFMAAAIGTAPALADPTGIFGTAVSGANTAIKNAENAQPQVIHLPDGTVAQVPPVTQSKTVGPEEQGAVGLPTGFTYTLDFSVAKPMGDVGGMTGWMPGGVDVVAGYGFNPTTRFVANYYELQHYPVGFNSGTVPLYLQGFANPIGSVNLGTQQPQINVTTKDRFLLLNFEKLFTLGKVGTHTVPIVITPTYVARWSKISDSPSHDDILPFQPNATNSFPLYGVHTRTAQVWSLAFTLPFLKTPKMFGTFTLAPGWLGHLAGQNQQNHAQLYQILYLEYTPTNTLKFFFEPQSSRDYLPADPYAQHLFAYFLGASQRIGKQGFVQLVLNSGGPTNEGAYGVHALVCQQLPCAPNQVVPVVGGLKATQLQIQFGIGSPSVIQF
jgi:hypothetical protein